MRSWLDAITPAAVLGVAFAAGVAWQSSEQNGKDLDRLTAAQERLTGIVAEVATRQAVNVERIEALTKRLDARPAGR